MGFYKLGFYKEKIINCYQSVERNINPYKTDLIVADSSRNSGTNCSLLRRNILIKKPKSRYQYITKDLYAFTYLIKEENRMIYYMVYNSPIGKLTIASDSENIIGLWIEGQKYFCETIDCDMIENNDLLVLQATKEWLDKYFGGEKPSIKNLPLKPKGSEFRQLVWKILCEIPYGEVTTYGEIAKIAFPDTPYSVKITSPCVLATTIPSEIAETSQSVRIPFKFLIC